MRPQRGVAAIATTASGSMPSPEACQQQIQRVSDLGPTSRPCVSPGRSDYVSRAVRRCGGVAPHEAGDLRADGSQPEPVLVYESGMIGAKPRQISRSIGDERLANSPDCGVSALQMFNYWIEGRARAGGMGSGDLNRRAGASASADLGH